MYQTIIYLTDEFIYIASKEKIEKVKLPKNLVLNGKVASINRFITKFMDISKKYNLNNSILGNKLKVLVHAKYTPADITLLKNIFEKLNFRKINIEIENKYYQLNQNNSWLNINSNYALLTYLNEYLKSETILIERNFFNNYLEFLAYIKSKIKNKNLFLIGASEECEKILKDFETQYGNYTYLFENSETFLLDCLLGLSKSKKIKQ